MGVDAANVAILLKAVGIGVPAAVVVLVYFIVSIIIKNNSAKIDKDRNEHVEKWNSMIDVQKRAIDQQGATMQTIIETNRVEMDRIIESHREQTDRLYKLYDNMSRSLEVACHGITTISRIIENKHFCPNQITKG